MTPDDLEHARVRHYRITGVQLPIGADHSRRMAFDLDQDGIVDNQLGQAHSSIVVQSPAYDVPSVLEPRLASDLGWTLTVYDDPATNDILAAYLAQAIVTGDGVLPVLDVEPALATAREPGAVLSGGTARVPLGALSDALGTAKAGWATMPELQILIDSVDDTTVTARLGIAVPDREAQDLVIPNIAAYFTSRYELGDSVFAETLDTNSDQVVSASELATNDLVGAMFAPDLAALPRLDEKSLSLGFTITAVR